MGKEEGFLKDALIRLGLAGGRPRRAIPGGSRNPKAIEGERRAAALLESKGLEILERNYTCDVGELDIVARDGGTLVFVEVKAREDDTYGHPLESITPAKQRKIRRVAEFYLLDRRLGQPPCRFDAVAVRLDKPDAAIEWVRDAF